MFVRSNYSCIEIIILRVSFIFDRRGLWSNFPSGESVIFSLSQQSVNEWESQVREVNAYMKRWSLLISKMRHQISFCNARSDHWFLMVDMYINMPTLMSLMCKYVPERSFVYTYIIVLLRNRWWWLIVAFRGHAFSSSSSLQLDTWPMWLISTGNSQGVRS